MERLFSQEINKLKMSSDEEGEESSSAEEDVQTLRCKGKSPANGSVARKKRAYVEIEYEQEMEPAAKSQATLWWRLLREMWPEDTPPGY